MKRTIKGNVNLGKATFTPLANVKQLDDIILELDIYSNSVPLDITGQTISLYAKRSNKTTVEQLDNITKDTTRVTINVKNSCFAILGITEMEFRLVDDTGSISTSTFYITVDESLSSKESINANNEIAILDEAKIEEPIRQANEDIRVSNENTRKTNEIERTEAEELRKQNEIARETSYKEITDARVDFDGSVHDSLNERLTEDMTQVMNRFNNASLLDYSGEYMTANESYEGMTEELTVNGNTLKNELTYNPNTWAEWYKQDDIVGDSTGLEFTTSTSAYRTAYINVNLKPNTKYGCLANVVSNTGTTLYVDPASGQPLNMTLGTTIGNVKSITTSKAEILLQTFRLALSPTTSELKAKIKDIRLYELPTGSQIESDFETLSSDELAVKYPFASGIRSVGESGENLELVSCGKNLFKGDISQGTLLIETGEERVTPQRCRTGYCPIKGNTKYYPSLANNLPDYTLVWQVFYDADFKHLGNIADVGYIIGTTKPFITPPNARYVRSIFSKTTEMAQLDLDLIKSNYQLEEGTTSTTYEPYQEHRQPIVLTEPLRGLPDGVRDTVDFERGIVVRNVGKIVLNGSENNWSLSTTQNNDSSLLFSTSILNIKNNALVVNEMISDKFNLYNCYNGLVFTNDGFCVHNDKVFMIRINKSKLTTPDLAGFKAWLQSNPTTVYYPLSVPVEEPITNLTQLRTYDKVTNVFTNGSLINPTIITKIPTNVNSVIKTLQAVNARLTMVIQQNSLNTIALSVDQEARLTKLELGVI